MNAQHRQSRARRMSLVLAVLTVASGVVLAWFLRGGLAASQERSLESLSTQHVEAVAQVMLTRLQVILDQVNDDAILFSGDSSEIRLAELALSRRGRNYRYYPPGSAFIDRASSDPGLPDLRSLGGPRLSIVDVDSVGPMLIVIAPVPAPAGSSSGVFLAYVELERVFELSDWADPGFHTAIARQNGAILADTGSRLADQAGLVSSEVRIGGLQFEVLALPKDATRSRLRTWLPEVVFWSIAVAAMLLAVAIRIAGALAAKAHAERAARIEVKKETLLRSAVFDHAAEGMCVFERHVDGSYRLVAHNDQVSEFLVAPVAPGSSQRPGDLFESDFGAQLESLMSGEFAGVEMRLLDCHDEPRALLVSGSHIDAGERNLVLVLFNDFTERRKLQFELAQIAAREQQRIGQDLHDVIGQQLAAIKVIGRTIQNGLKRENSPQYEPVSMLLSHVGEAIEQVRAVSAMLVPISRGAGFIQSLETLAQRVQAAFGVRIDLRVSRELVMSLSSEASTNLYRIIQEAINNSITHGKSTRIDVDFQLSGGDRVLKVEDNGTGLDEDVVPGIGIRSLEFRAEQIGWTLEVDSSESGGTVVRCHQTSPQTVEAR